MWKFGRKLRASHNARVAGRCRGGARISNLETLEPRRLLSASATLASNHVLYVIGTLGNDTIEVEQSGSNVSVSFDGSLMTIVGAGGTSLGTSVNTTADPIARINVRGLTGNDVITYDASVTEPGVIGDGSGSDQIIAPGTQALAIGANGGNDTVTLGGGNHLIGLGGGDDSVSVGDGNNAIGAYGGNDNFVLGNGDNLLGYVGGNVSVTAGTGDNAIFASGGSNSSITVTGGAGDDYISCGRGDATVDLAATTGNDVVHLGRGNCTVTAGSGDDLIFAEGGDDSIVGGSGTDTILTLAGHDTVTALGEDDLIVTLTNNNTITGGATDSVYGSTAPDPNNSGIPTGNWFDTLPLHWAIKLAAWEALT